MQTFLSAASALDYAEKFGCDALLCAINPPRLEGLFLAENIKNINPKVNIIFVAVCSEREHAKAVMRLKPSGHLDSTLVQRYFCRKILVFRLKGEIRIEAIL